MEQLLHGFRARGSPTNCLRHSAMISFQIHLVTQGDNYCSKVMKKNLKQSSDFNDLLTVRLARSKHIHNERNCPEQMVLQSRDPRYCVILNLAVFLEEWLTDGVGRNSSQWLFADGTTNQTRVKTHKTRKLKDARCFMQRP